MTLKSMAFGALNHPISRDVFLIGSVYGSLFFRMRHRNVSGYSKDESAYTKFTWIRTAQNHAPTTPKPQQCVGAWYCGHPATASKRRRSGHSVSRQWETNSVAKSEQPSTSVEFFQADKLKSCQIKRFDYGLTHGSTMLRPDGKSAATPAQWRRIWTLVVWCGLIHSFMSTVPSWVVN